MKPKGIGDIKRSRNINALRTRASRRGDTAGNVTRSPGQLKYEKNSLLKKLEQIEQQRALMERNLSDIAQVIQGEISRIEELERERQENVAKPEGLDKGIEDEEKQPSATATEVPPGAITATKEEGALSEPGAKVESPESEIAQAAPAAEIPPEATEVTPPLPGAAEVAPEATEVAPPLPEAAETSPEAEQSQQPKVAQPEAAEAEHPEQPELSGEQPAGEEEKQPEAVEGETEAQAPEKEAKEHPMAPKTQKKKEDTKKKEPEAIEKEQPADQKAEETQPETEKAQFPELPEQKAEEPESETTTEEPSPERSEEPQPEAVKEEEHPPETVKAESETSEPKKEKKPPEEAEQEREPEATLEEEQKGKIELPFGMGKLSFGDIFQGVGSFIDLVARMAEEQREKREGEFTSPSGRVKAVYGFSVQKGLGEQPSIEPFGNVKRTARGPVVEEERRPLVDVFDEQDHVSVIVELPGIDSKQVHTEIQGDILILSAASGERKYASEIVLPAGVDASTLTSKYKNGILELKMSKA